MENAHARVQPIQDQSQDIETDARSAVYQNIFSRRDVRGQFLPTPIPDDVLSRILVAAHHAPSVGFMQPWNFLLIKSPEVKQKVREAFLAANAEAADMFSEEKQALYRQLKLEGIIDSPINICITCDKDRAGPVVLGRTHIKTMDTYSTVCAVQNLWLAARAEGVGVGWVSVFKQEMLQQALNIPEHIIPIAYLCVGYVSDFYKKPELETLGWRSRLPIQELIYFDQWGQVNNEDSNDLVEYLKTYQEAVKQGDISDIFE